MGNCKEYIKPIDIEGYAMIGKITSAKSLACNKNREKILVELDNGETLCTQCLSIDEARICKKIIEFYRNIKIVSDDERYYHVACRGNEEDARR